MVMVELMMAIVMVIVMVGRARGGLAFVGGG